MLKQVLLLILISILPIQTIHASYTPPPYLGRITGQVLTGNHQQVAGFGDGLLPLLGNENQIVFIDGGVVLGQDKRVIYSGGSGFRQRKNTRLGEGIWGIFGFIDAYRSAAGNNYWQLNPGAEWLGTRYEGRLQGYVPLSSRNQTYQYTFGSLAPKEIYQDMGRNNTHAFGQGHSFFDTPVKLVEEFGPGIEAEAGRFINYGHGIWVRAGVYYFGYRNARQVNGAEANIELFISKQTSIIIQNNYDNQNKNRFSLGARVSLGGADGENNSLERQMTAPIIRHIARQSYGDALPTRRLAMATGSTYESLSNVWFFSPFGVAPVGAATTFANCTAENPCSTIDTPTATQINVLAPNANFFFESGHYSIPQTMGSSWVNLQNNQTFYGRTDNWIAPAAGVNRPVILGGLVWGNVGGAVAANGRINQMIVNNQEQIVPGGVLGGPNAVTAASANGNLRIQGSDLISHSTGTATFAYGARAINSLGINSSRVSTIGGGNFMTETIGLEAVNGTVSANNSNIIVRSSGSLLDRVIGVQAVNNSAIISNSTVTASAPSGIISEVSGVFANNNINVTGSIITATANGGLAGLVSGLNSDNGNVFVTNSTVNANSVGQFLGFVAGINVNNAGNATLNHANISGSTQTGLAWGIRTLGTVNFIGSIPSRVAASAPNFLFATPISLLATVNNNSTVPSICVRNGVIFNC